MNPKEFWEDILSEYKYQLETLEAGTEEYSRVARSMNEAMSTYVKLIEAENAEEDARLKREEAERVNDCDIWAKQTQIELEVTRTERDFKMREDAAKIGLGEAVINAMVRLGGFGVDYGRYRTAKYGMVKAFEYDEVGERYPDNFQIQRINDVNRLK